MKISLKYRYEKYPCHAHVNLFTQLEQNLSLNFLKLLLGFVAIYEVNALAKTRKQNFLSTLEKTTSPWLIF